MVTQASLLKPVIMLIIELVNALAKFFTVHFAKAMTITGVILAFIFLCIFLGTRK